MRAPAANSAAAAATAVTDRTDTALAASPNPTVPSAADSAAPRAVSRDLRRRRTHAKRDRIVPGGQPSATAASIVVRPSKYRRTAVAR